MPAHDYFVSGTLSLTFRMPPKQTHDLADEPTTTPSLKDPTGGASTLIIISARCIGHLGFALSLFSIWFGWLLPAFLTAQATQEPNEIKKPRQVVKPTRRPTLLVSSVPQPQPPVPIRRVSAPVDLTPILSKGAEETYVASRHVYFADSPPVPPILRRNTMPEPVKSSSIMQSFQQMVCNSVSSSPPLTPSELPDNQPHAFHPACDTLDETTPESDSRHSSRTSLSRPSSRLQKLKLGFNTKTRPSSADGSADHSSIASTETSGSDKSTRRSSGGFVPPWSLTRNRTAPDVTAVEPANPSPSRLSFGRRVSPAARTPSPGPCPVSDMLSPTFLSRKAQNRTSAPIPRTSPYAAPYFATPPILLDTGNYPSYLKNLPQFEDEVKAAPLRGSDSDTEIVRGRTPGIRRVSLNPPLHIVQNRRSSSVDFNTRAL